MDLFSDTSSRSKRQEEAVQKWVNSKLVGTLMCPTGFGFCRTGKFYYSNEYIPVNVEAVPIEKSSELLSGNIGESPTVEGNTEINSEIKESESLYSVEDETI